MNKKCLADHKDCVKEPTGEAVRSVQIKTNKVMGEMQAISVIINSTLEGSQLCNSGVEEDRL